MRPRFLQLCLELHGFVVEHRELRLKTLVLSRLHDDVLGQSRQLHLETFDLLQAILVVLVRCLLREGKDKLS